MSQFNAPAYEITRSSGQCALTGRTLEPGEAYMSTLVEADPTAPITSVSALGLHRLDISMEAWDQGQRPPRLFSHWKSVVPEPNQRKKLFVDDEVLMNLLRRLADAEQEQRLAFRFVLALILMRKKLLRYEGSEKRTATILTKNEDGSDGEAKTIEREWWIMTPKLDAKKGHFGKWNEEDKLEILDPHLDEAQIQSVTQQLNEILDSEL